MLSSSAGSDRLLQRHPASLVPRHLHDPLLLGLLKAPVNDDLIDYVADSTFAVVASPLDPVQLPTPPTTPHKASFRHTLSRTLKQQDSSPSESSDPVQSCSKVTSVPSLSTFIKLTAARANAQAPTLLVTLVYLDRLRLRLKGAKAAKGMQCTYHRLFLACLIAAAKYCNDCCPRNIHWVKWSSLFTLSEVNLMEQELLMLLDHDLRVDEKDLLAVCAPFLPSCAVDKATSALDKAMDKATSAMDRQTPSMTSCATSRSPSSDSQSPISTPTCSPVVIRLDATHLVHSSLTSPAHRERPKPNFVGANSSVTVITRAKSWYGSLRAATS